MYMKKLAAWLLLLTMLLPILAAAETLEPLPMDTLDIGPRPKDDHYSSDLDYKDRNYSSETAYEDESISVKLYRGRYADSDYVYAHVKISHPSQLRTASAVKKNFHYSGTAKAKYIARDANAVVAINGDFYTQKDACQIVLRQGKQYRNVAEGLRDILIIDKNGDLSYMNQVWKKEYNTYYEEHKDEMYQVLCFGPVLVENGVSVITEEYHNGSIGSGNMAQRSAIAQIGPLEYALITSWGPQSKGNKGMTIYEFAQVCELIGKELSEDGFKLAYNLDGGNSAALVFKKRNENNQLEYTKVNSPDVPERTISDIIYFATLVK